MALKRGISHKVTKETKMEWPAKGLSFLYRGSRVSLKESIRKLYWMSGILSAGQKLVGFGRTWRGVVVGFGLTRFDQV